MYSCRLCCCLNRLVLAYLPIMLIRDSAVRRARLLIPAWLPLALIWDAAGLVNAARRVGERSLRLLRGSARFLRGCHPCGLGAPRYSNPQPWMPAKPPLASTSGAKCMHARGESRAKQKQVLRIPSSGSWAPRPPPSLARRRHSREGESRCKYPLSRARHPATSRTRIGKL